MKRILLLLLLSVPLAAFPETGREWVETNYAKYEYLIPMRDGTRLYTAVYAPRKTQHPGPILLTRTPYSCRPYGSGYATSLWNSYLSEYLERGYIMVFQDVRGRWMSQGRFEQVRPLSADGSGPDEASDTYDTAEWLLRNIAGNNGRIGVWGNSYCGFYTLMAALCGHPAIAAVTPQAPIGDWYMGDDIHHNGALMMWDAFGFIGGNTGRHLPAPGTDMPPAPRFYEGSASDFFLGKGCCIAALTRMLGDEVPFWNEIVAHPDYDDFWKRRASCSTDRTIRPAVMVVGGLYDAEDCYGTWYTYRRIREMSPETPLSLVAGPWPHGGWRSAGKGNELGEIVFGEESLCEFYQKQIEVPFFGYYLEGRGERPATGALVFFSGSNGWRRFPAWPPESSGKMSLYLSENGRLEFEATQARRSSTTYRSDPADPVPYMESVGERRDRSYMVADQRFASRRSDVVTFSTEPLAEDITLAGPVDVELYVSLSSTDADFVVKLIDVYPDDMRGLPEAAELKCGSPEGYQMLVRGEVMRGRYRRGFDRPAPFVAGRTEPVPFRMPDIAHTFRREHRIMIQVQSTWFPLVDRNPQRFVDIYRCSPDDFTPADVTLHHSRRAASRLSVGRITGR